VWGRQDVLYPNERKLQKSSGYATLRFTLYVFISGGFHHLQEHPHDARVKQLSCHGAKVFACLLWRLGGLIGLPDRERIPRDGNRENARRQRNLFSGKSARIAAAIPVFVMTERNIEGGAQVDGRREISYALYG